MNILSPTSITSNKICQWPVAQQLVGLAMLYRLFSLCVTRGIYVQATLQKKIVAREHEGKIAIALKALQIEVDQFAFYEGLAKVELKYVSPQLRTEAKFHTLALLLEQLPQVVERREQLRVCEAAKAIDLGLEDQKIAEAEAIYKQDKEFLIMALKRLVPVWSTYISYKKVAELKKAASAA